MSSNLRTRLARIEAVMNPTPVCRTCYGYPNRIVFIDEETNDVLSESLPAEGCPDCNRTIVHELHIVGSESLEEAG